MPSREVFWNIRYSYVIYILAAIAVAFLVFSIDCSKNIGRRMGVFIRGDRGGRQGGRVGFVPAQAVNLELKL